MVNKIISKETEHLENYRDYTEQLQSFNIKFGKDSALKDLIVRDILPLVHSHPFWNETTPGFWYYHKRTPHYRNNVELLIMYVFNLILEEM